MPWNTKLLFVALAPVCFGCSGGEKVPDSAYDPKVVEAARLLAEESKRQPIVEEQNQEELKGECQWETGGCQVGWICWDSWFCKEGFEDECSAQGDKMCHKECTRHEDCPTSMPYCKEIPIFKGSDRGTLEKFCVKKKR